ncbi:hypothetical protein [Fusobacterium mortiferum]|uniref:hypothetical protein n=1 Tax=Fusobacterium mortiferum TaxID=850 RepID=UPI001F321C49|nr:hypothetical protein [Fusobacterium mortiferum]MCF2698206.1 hypothetical protein [Fusobacterium mortiferum]
MAMNYTEKFAERIDERFYPTTVSHHATNNDYDFVGAKTIKITSINVGENKDYDRAKGYGEAQQLENEIQELTMSKDRGFKIVLDKMDEEETKIKAGEVLARQKREVTDPEVEKYRFGKMLDVVSASDTNKIVGEAGKEYEKFLDANMALDDANIPTVGRVAFVTPAFLKGLKLNDSFIKATEIAQNMLIRGQIGELDGVPIVKVTKAWMEDNTAETTVKYDCLIAHKSATVAPIKLAEYKVITDSEDYSGTVFLGRFYHDCFILNNKKKGLAGITRP